MGGFTAGLVTGCLLGVCGTFLLLSVSAAFSANGTRIFHLKSIPGTILSAVALLLVAGFSRRMGIGKDAAVLLLLFSVLAISKLEGLLNGLIATALAALILVVEFFPPVGSMMMTSSSDRLALALFLLIGTLGSRIICGTERSET